MGLWLRHGAKRPFFLRKERPFGFPKKKLGRIGRMPSSVSAVRAGTLEASIEHYRFSSACGAASIPIGRLLPLYFCTSRPGRWRKAIETVQSSGSGKRGFDCRQTARRSIETGTIALKALSFGSNPFSFRKENGFAAVAGATRPRRPQAAKSPSPSRG